MGACYNLNMQRSQTKVIQVGNRLIGGQNQVLIQTMPTKKTSDYPAVIAQILDCEPCGLDLVRVSILDQADVMALNHIKRAIHVPLIVDLHFDFQLALLTLEQNIDKIRINPMNIGGVNEYKEIIRKAKDKGIPMRLGFNEGSLNDVDKMLEKAREYIVIAQSLEYDDFVLSFKFSSVRKTIEVYEKAAEMFPYPLHIGLTESGIPEIGLIKSAAALGPLLLQGIGDTIRISLTAEPVDEVKAARRLLKALELNNNWPTLISCPTCGRCEVDLFALSAEINDFVERNQINKTIAIMGCPVNGPGEAKEADIGLAGNKNNTWTLFKHGKTIRIIDGKNVLAEFKKELLSL